MDRIFRHYTLDNGLNLYVLPTEKFKTTMLKLFWHQNLDEAATENALMAMVMRRGTSRHPETSNLNQAFDALYGAEFDSRIVKKGERQIIEFELELVNDSLINEPLFERGLELLREVLVEPLANGNSFNADFLQQEKGQLRQIIEGIFNDKIQYAMERCLEEAGKGEKFGLSRYGKVEDFSRIQPESLFSHYLERRNAAPIDVFVVGNVNPEEVWRLVNRVFNFSRKGDYVLHPVDFTKTPARVREVVEKQEVNQGKLNFAYRTNVSYASPEYPALAVYNGVLGGFAHSKLFQNVREKASLAYYASSRLEKTKGILLIAAGIEFENYRRARRIIEQQIEAMAEGQITDLELTNTKKALLHQLRSRNDNHHLMIETVLDGLVNGRTWQDRELMQAVEAVSIADLIAIAQGVKLDTVYFLTNPEGAGVNG